MIDTLLKLPPDAEGPAAQRRGRKAQSLGDLLALFLVQHFPFGIVLLDEIDAFRGKLAETLAEAIEPCLLFL